MKWLIYGGSRGWIGSQIVECLKKKGEEVFIPTSRAEDVESVTADIDMFRPDRVICAIGRTHGTECDNIDFLEKPGMLVVNIRDNLQAPVTIAQVCKDKNIHMTYLGTGCIYSGDNDHFFTQEETPNFFGSQYSTVKGLTDTIMRRLFDGEVLNLRIRMPFSSTDNPRNLISKIIRYKKIHDTWNSMTYLNELIPVLIELSCKKTTGTFNFVNKGSISLSKVLYMYRKIVDTSHQCELISETEFRNLVSAERSVCTLDTAKLQSPEYYPGLLAIEDAILSCFITWKTPDGLKKNGQ